MCVNAQVSLYTRGMSFHLNKSFTWWNPHRITFPLDCSSSIFGAFLSLECGPSDISYLVLAKNWRVEIHPSRNLRALTNRFGSLIGWFLVTKTWTLNKTLLILGLGIVTSLPIYFYTCTWTQSTWIKEPFYLFTFACSSLNASLQLIKNLQALKESKSKRKNPKSESPNSSGIQLSITEFYRSSKVLVQANHGDEDQVKISENCMKSSPKKKKSKKAPSSSTPGTPRPIRRRLLFE